MDTAELVIKLLFVVAFSGLLVRWTRLPAPFVQIALGCVLAWPALAGIHVALDPELFLLLFIPPLLFLDGLNAPKREFRALWVPIAGLAFGLVFTTIAVIGPLLHWLIPAIPLPVAYALAAVLSPTDAVAVTSLVDREKIPPSLMHLLEGEALLNDASGLVVFRFAIAAALSGHFSLNSTFGPFVLVAAGGALAGFATLMAVAAMQKLIARLGDVPPEVQVLVNILLPFAAYLFAEHFHVSGIIAAVTAGLLFRWAGMYRHTGLAAGIQSTVVWEAIAFTFNGMIFLLLGLQLPDIIRRAPPELSTRHFFLEPIVWVAVLTAGLLAVRFAFSLVSARVRYWLLRGLGKKASDLPQVISSLVLTFAGVRGAITLAGVMSIPLVLPNGEPFPGRDIAVFLAAGVILCSMLPAAVLLPFIAGRLTLPEVDPIEAEERLARITAARAAIERIQTLTSGDDVPETARAVADRVIASYHLRMAAAEEGGTAQEEARFAAAVERKLRLAAISAEREAVRELFKERKINDEVILSLANELALRETTLRRSAST